MSNTKATNRQTLSGHAAGSPAAAGAVGLGEVAVRTAHGGYPLSIEVRKVRGEGWTSEVRMLSEVEAVDSDALQLRIEIARAVMPRLCGVPLAAPDPRDWGAEVGILNALSLDASGADERRLMDEVADVVRVLLLVAGDFTEVVHKARAGGRHSIPVPDPVYNLATRARQQLPGERWRQVSALAREQIGTRAKAPGLDLDQLSDLQQAELARDLLKRSGLGRDAMEAARTRGAAWRRDRLARGDLNERERALLEDAPGVPAIEIVTNVAIGRARPGHEIEDAEYWWRVLWLRLVLGVDAIGRGKVAVVTDGGRDDGGALAGKPV